MAAPPPPLLMVRESCLRCEYSLEGLAADAVCPECGFPAAQSRERSGWLRSADFAWVGRLSRGMRHLNWSIWLLGGWFVAVLVLMIVDELVLGSRLGFGSRGGIGDASFYVVAVAAAGLHILGCVQFAASGHGDYAASARVRWALLVCGIAMPVLIGLSMLLRDWFAASGPWITRGFVLTAQVVILGWFFALAAALEQYEQRTESWNPSRERAHGRVRRNLYGVIILVFLMVWFRGGGIGMQVGDPGVMLFGLTYLAFTVAITRVQRATDEELVVAEAIEMVREEKRRLQATDASGA